MISVNRCARYGSAKTELTRSTAGLLLHCLYRAGLCVIASQHGQRKTVLRQKYVQLLARCQISQPILLPAHIDPPLTVQGDTAWGPFGAICQSCSKPQSIAGDSNYLNACLGVQNTVFLIDTPAGGVNCPGYNDVSLRWKAHQIPT